MQSVIGVFDTQEDAESARESLLRAGFDEEDVRVQSHRSIDDQDGSVPSRRDDEDEGIMARVGHFFSDLFGSSDDDTGRYAGHYAEHVRRGGSVVVVDVDDESRVDAARSALATAGAVDIDLRTEAWRTEGYSGFDAESRPYGADEVRAERSRSEDTDRALPVVKVIQRRPVNPPAGVAGTRAADSGAIELGESTERSVVSKTTRVGDDVSMGQRSSISGHSSEADMGVGMSGSSYSSTGSGSDTLSAARTFSGDDKSQSAMSWQQRNSNAPAYDDSRRSMDTSGSSRDPDDEMAYRYGTTLRSDQRYAGRSSWDDVEADARADWSEHNPNSNWEQAKAAVRNGWESMTGRR